MIGICLEELMESNKKVSREVIDALWSHINKFKNQLMSLEKTANSIDYQIYEMSSNDLFHFEDFNLNEGIELLHSILSRRIYYLNKKEGKHEENN